jgi:glycosyltransferase involved in cell wall biosynthesis
MASTGERPAFRQPEESGLAAGRPEPSIGAMGSDREHPDASNVISQSKIDAGSPGDGHAHIRGVGLTRGAGDLTPAPAAVRVSVVIPALNEAKNLPYVIAGLPRGLHELIVVDGHSTDDTVAVARRLRPDARIVVQSGRGKGEALAAGFAACTGDVVVTLDADGSTDPSEIPRFVAALHHGADFVKGSRFAQGGASSDITRVRRLGNRALNGLVNALYGTSYTDLCYGYNAFWARCLPYMRVDCAGFEVETLINVRIAKAGLIIHEVPSRERARIHGRSNLNAIDDGIRVLFTILVERLSAASRSALLPRLRRRLTG